MPDNCVCYAVDRAYLFPAVAGAIKSRRMLPADAADVVVVCFDMPGAVERDFSRLCASEGIILRSVDARVLEGMSGFYANIFLDRFLPDLYAHLIYMDADTQSWGAVEELVRAEVPKDGFLAAADPMAFELDGSGARSVGLARYMASLGLDAGGRRAYFNSGVLRINRDGWNGLAMEALRFLKARPELCRFADQSALNAVSRGRHRPMSLRWNFPAFLRNSGLEHDIAPAIYHFMSRPKPWEGNYPPWNKSFTLPYVSLLRRHPPLRAYLRELPWTARARYTAQQWLKRGYESASWRTGSRHRAIMEYEANIARPLGRQ